MTPLFQLENAQNQPEPALLHFVHHDFKNRPSVEAVTALLRKVLDA